ncbi:MAG: amino acid ABC transporter substrate-binding protein [Gammaproteobacteria bacterium]|nr:amino acid ABC transporter substrate-binding protein [Gammaproteobacteria bacterium]
MRIVTLILAVIFLLAPQIGTAESSPTLERIKQTGNLRIGFRESEPPMSFLNKENKPIGYSIDLCTRIANEVQNTLGIQDISIEFVPVTAANRFDAIAKDEIDILCGATTKTISRTELVDFTQLTFVTGASLLSLKQNGVEGVSGLQGKRVAVVKDTTTIDQLTKALKDGVIDASVIPVNTAVEGMRALVAGEVDAFSSDQVVLIGLALTHKGPEKFSIAGEAFSFEPFALAVKRNDSAFRSLADRTLSRLNRRGQITPIYVKWFGKYSKKVPTMLQAMYILNSTPE